MKLIPVAKPEIGKAERKAVDRVMRSGLLAQGPEVSNFEKEFSKFVEDRECVAVNSGTSALHVALLSLGVGKGDEVIVPSFTFAATANSVALTGATPVFVDIDPKTFCIDPIEIVKAITPKTKAIQVVHLYGLAAEMPAIMKIAKKYKLLVVEDAAQAHLATINGKPVGSFGDAAAFSFYPTKNMTSGEGGMIVFKDASAARTARLYRNQGMEKRYENEVVGFNLRMTDIHAAIGRVQLSKLKEKTQRRQENANYLSKNILNLVAVPIIPKGYSHVFHQYTIKVPGNRDSFASQLNHLGIGSGVYYPTPVHLLPSYQKKECLPVTEKICKQALSLPIHPSLTKGDLRRIADAVNRLSEKTIRE
jgi:dTDP-4-amino-4,6-dideoxygalactose transaminase